MPEWRNTSDLIANARDYYPALARLLGDYFPEDWEGRYGSWEGAVDGYVSATSGEDREEAVRELDDLLSRVADHLVVDRVLWPGFWCSFTPSVAGLSSVEWLRAVRRRMSGEM